MIIRQHRPVDTIVKSNEFKSLISALSLYSFLVSALSPLYENLGASGTVVYLEMASVLSFIYYWRITTWGVAKYSSFGGALILFAIVFRLLAAVDILLNGIDETKWPPTLPVYGSFEWLFIKGEAITQMGFLLTLAAWRMAVTGSLVYLGIGQKIRLQEDRSKLLKLYFLALGVTGLFRLTSVDFGGLAQLTAGLIFIGIAAIYLYASGCRSRWNRVGISFLMALPLAFVSLKSGMKEAIFMPFVPCFLLIWCNFNGLPVRALIMSGSLGIFAVGQIYASYVRNNLWNSSQDESTLEIVMNVYDGITEDSFAEALGSAFQRVNYAMAHAMTMAVVERNGFYFDEVYVPLPATFIPRLLWPDKPAIQPGSAHTRRILGSSRDISEMTSATAAGFYAEMYLGGGYMIFFISAIAYGLMIGQLQVWVLRRLPPIATALFSYRLLYQAIRFDENPVLYAYNGMILFIITLLLAMKVLYPTRQVVKQASNINNHVQYQSVLKCTHREN